MKKTFIRTAFLMSLVLCLAVVAFGQETTGSIEGTVKDPTGAAVPNGSSEASRLANAARL